MGYSTEAVASRNMIFISANGRLDENFVAKMAALAFLSALIFSSAVSDCGGLAALLYREHASCTYARLHRTTFRTNVLTARRRESYSHGDKSTVRKLDTVFKRHRAFLRGRRELLAGKKWVFAVSPFCEISPESRPGHAFPRNAQERLRRPCEIVYSSSSADKSNIVTRATRISGFTFLLLPSSLFLSLSLSLSAAVERYMSALVRFPASFEISGLPGGTESTSDAEGPGSSAIKVARSSSSSHSCRRHCQSDIHMQQPEEISSLVNLSLSLSLSLSRARWLSLRGVRSKPTWSTRGF